MSLESEIRKIITPKIINEDKDCDICSDGSPCTCEKSQEEIDERKGVPRVHAKTFSGMNLKKARELMSPAKNRQDGINRVAKGMGISKAKATKYHDDVMKSYGFKPESLDKTLEDLPSKGVKNLLVICPGFASDCVETLEEINIQGRESFLNKGGENFDLIPCLNDNSDHINLFEDLVRKYI